MLKNIIVGAFVGLPVAAILMAGSGSRSDGAPVSSTGAPDETTCAMAGCHSDNTVNSGTAMPEIIVEGNPSTYEPGKTYKFTTRISDPDKMRFGFQLVALNKSDNSNAGKLSLVDSDRTQILKNYLKLLDRDYITYTYSGTEAVSNGLGEWSFLWTAPTENVGPIKFYAAFASANNDKTDKGDYIYTKELELSPSSAGLNSSVNNSKFSFTVQATRNSFRIMLWSSMDSRCKVTGYSLNGKQVTKAVESRIQPGQNSLELPWIASLSKGVYLLKVEADNQLVTKKVIVQ